MVNEKFEAYKQLLSDSDQAMISAEKARLGGDVAGAKILSDKAALMKETASEMFNPKVKNPKTGGEIPWNFTKFLVDRDGKVLARFDSAVEPESKEVMAAVEKALAGH